MALFSKLPSGGGVKVKTGTITITDNGKSVKISGFDKKPTALYLFSIYASSNEYVGVGDIVNLVYENNSCYAHCSEYVAQNAQSIGKNVQMAVSYSNGSMILTYTGSNDIHFNNNKYMYVWY